MRNCPDTYFSHSYWFLAFWRLQTLFFLLSFCSVGYSTYNKDLYLSYPSVTSVTAYLELFETNINLTFDLSSSCRWLNSPIWFQHDDMQHTNELSHSAILFISKHRLFLLPSDALFGEPDWSPCASPSLLGLSLHLGWYSWLGFRHPFATIWLSRRSGLARLSSDRNLKVFGSRDLA